MKKIIFIFLMICISKIIFSQDNIHDDGLLILKIETNGKGWYYSIEPVDKSMFNKNINSYKIKEKGSKNDSGYYAIKIDSKKEYFFSKVKGGNGYWQITKINKIYKVGNGDILWGGIISIYFDTPETSNNCRIYFEDGTNEDFMEALNVYIKVSKDKKWVEKSKEILLRMGGTQVDNKTENNQENKIKVRENERNILLGYCVAEAINHKENKEYFDYLSSIIYKIDESLLSLLNSSDDSKTEDVLATINEKIKSKGENELNKFKFGLIISGMKKDLIQKNKIDAALLMNGLVPIYSNLEEKYKYKYNNLMTRIMLSNNNDKAMKSCFEEIISGYWGIKYYWK
jgi:hypothetical protein